MRDPPLPDCEDRPYEADFVVTSVNSTQVVATFSSDAEGAFNVTLTPGEYAIRLAKNTGGPPTCENAEPIVVRADAWTAVNITCDSGIR